MSCPSRVGTAASKAALTVGGVVVALRVKGAIDLRQEGEAA